MDFVFLNGGPQGKFEKAVGAQGWKWMHTNRIDRTRPGGYTGRDGRPDRLGQHFHHGKSTHMIVSGDLRIQKHGGDYGMYELSDRLGGKRQDLVQPNTPYSATSKTGCTFVEGHEALSPQSAERFITRGTLRLARKPGAPWDYPGDDELKIWLRSVRFNPGGKAHPDLAKGEKRILDARHIFPPIPEDFLTALSEWFEAEWQRPSWWQRLVGLRIVLLLVTIFWYVYLF
ncbi:hypothetical protein F4824DRAFT_501085 [Ustulina deusta]|nr:hypothetical protein F4824DRAFT_501085 [Ustulina deusta]